VIHHAATIAQLTAAIEAQFDTPARAQAWWRKAHADVQRAIADGKHDQAAACWTDVKGAYIALQHDKCAYCELPMPQGAKSRIAYDVEHHRPKSRTRPWPDARTRQALGITYQVGAGRTRGYPELAHHPLNYLVACKVCNSPYKADRFPVLGQADPDGTDPRVLNQRELPAIPLPLGDWGDDPAAFLDFEGFIAVPAAGTPMQQLRAQIVIDFFDLNRRADLLLGRATAIALLHGHLKEVQAPDLARNAAEAQRWVDAALDASAPYAAAARAYHRLHLRNPARAGDVARMALRYVASKNPGLTPGPVPT
jgi:hypothetical protein